MSTDFRARTVPELTRLYNGMCRTASDLGVPHQRSTEFATPDALIAACEALEQQITEFRAGLSVGDEAQHRGSPGLRRLRQHPQAETIRQAVLTDNAGARVDAARRLQEEKMTDVAATGPAPAEGGKKKAKKAKTAKTAKKAAPKKAAAKTNGAGRAGAIPGDAKITVSAAAQKENPRRKGTGQHERFAVLQKHHGKTVDEYMKKGERTTLNLAVERGEVKVSKGA